jgi:hypothetical protein
MPNSAFSKKCDVYATTLLNEFKIDSLPIDPRSIAAKLDIKVIEEDLSGCDGCFMRAVKAIVVNKSMDEGRKNFTIAHELGHSQIPHHTNAEYKDYRERLGFPITDRQEEREADEFASELLMPRFLISGIVKSEKISLHTAQLLSDKCRTSFISSTLAYVNCSPELCAVAVSEASKIKYFFPSASLKKKKGFVGAKTPLHKLSHAFSFFNEQGILAKSGEEKGKVQNIAWLSDFNYSDYICFEHSQSLAGLSQIISLVWWVPIHDDLEDDEDGDVYISED